MVTRSDLEFDVALSKRYHRRRAAFLERINRILTLITLISGTSAFVTITGYRPDFPVSAIASLIIVAIGLIQVVYAPERCAAAHRQWHARWTKLAAQIDLEEAPSAERLKDWTDEKHAIEAECVEEMRALQVDCANRTMRALEREGEPVRLRFYHRWFMQFVSFEHLQE